MDLPKQTLRSLAAILVVVAETAEAGLRSAFRRVEPLVKPSADLRNLIGRIS